MSHWLKQFLERRRARRIYKATAFLRVNGYRVDPFGSSIKLDLDKAINNQSEGASRQQEIQRE